MESFINTKLWSLFQITPAPRIVTVHQIGNPILVTSKSLFLRFCIFEDINNQVVSISGETPVVIDSTSFYRISYDSMSACFELNLTDSASAALIKACFVLCNAQRFGSGRVYTAEGTTTISQCAIASFNDPQQVDSFRINSAVQQIDSINSSYNIVKSCPLFSSNESTICSCRMAIAVGNHPYTGIVYFAKEEARIHMCSFVDNTLDKLNDHGVLSFYFASAVVTCCDFIRNSGPMLLNSQSTAVYKNCMFRENPRPSGSDVQVLNSVSEENVVKTREMRADDCHFYNEATLLIKQKLLNLTLAFALC